MSDEIQASFVDEEVCITLGLPMLDDLSGCFIKVEIMSKVIVNRIGLNTAGQAIRTRLKKTIEICIARQFIHDLDERGIGWIDLPDISKAALGSNRHSQRIPLQDK